MNTSAVKLYSLGYAEAKTWLVAAAFVAGNILLPQLCHLIPQGGHILLPIYFFTLIAAYKYGWKAGLLTAIASPLANAVLFGMPAAAALPTIMLKSVILAIVAGAVASRSQRVTLATMAAVVLSYQVLGSLGEWAISGSFAEAATDFRLGLPGMALQIVGGWAIIRYIIRK